MNHDECYIAFFSLEKAHAPGNVLREATLGWKNNFPYPASLHTLSAFKNK